MMYKERDEERIIYWPEAISSSTVAAYAGRGASSSFVTSSWCRICCGLERTERGHQGRWTHNYNSAWSGERRPRPALSDEPMGEVANGSELVHQGEHHPSSPHKISSYRSLRQSMSTQFVLITSAERHISWDDKRRGRGERWARFYHMRAMLWRVVPRFGSVTLSLFRSFPASGECPVTAALAGPSKAQAAALYTLDHRFGRRCDNFQSSSLLSLNPGMVLYPSRTTKLVSV